MNEKKVVIIGGSFAGLSAAYELEKLLGKEHQITLINQSKDFVFIPSLPWVAVNYRRPDKIVFDLEAAVKRTRIDFRVASVTRIDAAANKVFIGDEEVGYDYLLIATGAGLKFNAVKGLGPHGGYTQSVCNLEHALLTRDTFNELLENPGPVVVGATQGASCFGAAYEFVFNLESALRKYKKRRHVPITFVTSEPYLGHFGIGGLGASSMQSEQMLLSREIEYFSNVAINSITENEITLSTGEVLPFNMAMLIPPFTGVEAISNSGDLGNEAGFIPTDKGYRHVKYPNIYAAGISVAVAPPKPTPIPTGIPKTGYTSEIMGMTAAENIAADIKGGEYTTRWIDEFMALCMLDMGQTGISIFAYPIFPPHEKYYMQFGKWVHLAKIGFEKYFLYKMKHGAVWMDKVALKPMIWWMKLLAFFDKYSRD